MMKDLSSDKAYKREWKGFYRGIYYVFCRWWCGSESDGHWIWNYYIWFIDKQFPTLFPKLWKCKRVSSGLPSGRKFFRYSQLPVINDIDFHGGVTYFKKHYDFEGGVKSVEIGCDYNHLWNMEQGYSETENSVFYDVKNTIDRLLEMEKDVLFRCLNDGKYYRVDEGNFTEDGYFRRKEK